HVDVILVEPSAERNYYTLVTMGMGAHTQNAPKGYDEHIELFICLPADWDIKSSADGDFWPIGLLKFLARLPIGNNTWLGYGHTIPNITQINGKLTEFPYASNTKLSGAIITHPTQFPEESHVCKIPTGKNVRFFQVVPIYPEEMDAKLIHGADALLKLFDYARPVDINRKLAVKTAEEIQKEIEEMKKKM
ncbi:MAG: suppressor of fused domain protein, partial [Firmicutes bacterium]|nr:suppressor of fused domain protein [Bacillota bacterium]